MNLSPTESERMTIFAAAEFARRNLRSGIALSHPEAVAFLTDEAMLMARSGLSYDEVRQRAGTLLEPAQVEPGVASMLRLIMIELPMAEGTKLLALFDPIPCIDGDLVPGEIIPRDANSVQTVMSTPEDCEIEVINGGDRDIQVRSMTHFFEVNPALRFDRSRAYGMRLAVAAGAGIRFEPGIPKRVRLTPVSGTRVVRGHAGLVDGPLDDPAVRDRAFQRAQECGYLGRSQ